MLSVECNAITGKKADRASMARDISFYGTPHATQVMNTQSYVVYKNSISLVYNIALRLGA